MKMIDSRFKPLLGEQFKWRWYIGGGWEWQFQIQGAANMRTGCLTCFRLQLYWKL